MRRPRTIDELLYHMPAVEREAASAWAKDFARSILVKARWRRWNPSQKEEAIMRRLVSELFDQNPDPILSEEDENA